MAEYVRGHFNDNSDGYRRYRPVYPEALFGYLASLVPTRDHAWDCACGTGQAALPLASHFKRVTATDVSASQLANIEAQGNIEYRQAPAEASGLPDASVDLVTVAQALHWFDHDAFYRELRRVAKPVAVIAAWSYGLFHISDEVDAVVYQLYENIVGRYWPAERRYIENGYADIPFPFEIISAPGFSMQANWSLAQVRGYLGTWSAVRRYQSDKGDNPLQQIDADLTRAWGDDGHERAVSWPLVLRLGRVHS